MSPFHCRQLPAWLRCTVSTMHSLTPEMRTHTLPIFLLLGCYAGESLHIAAVASTGWEVASTQVILHIATHNPFNRRPRNESTQLATLYTFDGRTAIHFYSGLFLRSQECAPWKSYWLSTKLQHEELSGS